MRAFLIHNPISGYTTAHRALGRALAEFRAGGWQVETHETTYRGHAGVLAKEAAQQGYRCLIVAGGDGSLAQVVDGLVRSGATDVSLGVIPLGTGNVFAREVRLPIPRRRDDAAASRAARIIMAGDAVPLDVGMTDKSAFLCWAGCGFDGEVTDRVERNLEFKHRAPIRTYLKEALLALIRHQPVPMQIILDGHTWLEGRFSLVAVCNVGLYGRYFHMAPAARLNDGFFDVTALACVDSVHFLYTSLKLLLYPRTRDPAIVHRRCQQATLTAQAPTQCHLDGDPAGPPPLHITLLPQRLPILLDRSRARRCLVETKNGG